MKTEYTHVPFLEFLTISLTCFSAMDILVMEKGYEALTLDNVCKRTGISEERLLNCFQYFEVLLSMYDTKITVSQMAKLKEGKIKLE